MSFTTQSNSYFLKLSDLPVTRLNQVKLPCVDVKGNDIKSSWKDTQKIKIKNLKKSIDKWNTSRYNTQALGRLAQLARASA